MNIFSSLKVYMGKWNVKSTRNFEAEEIDAVEHAVVVPSKYGNSVQFTMVNGGLTYIPLDQGSTLGVGEVVDLHKAEIITLCKSGEADIFRISI